MGQTLSIPAMKSLSCSTSVSSGFREKLSPVSDPCTVQPAPMPKGEAAYGSSDVFSPSRDYTANLPDDCLALIFQSLGSGHRKQCSLVCRRWLIVDGQSRQRLALDARAGLLQTAPAIFARFEAVSKLALKCDYHAESIGDDAPVLIAARCPNLSRLKLRSCRAITTAGMADVAGHCSALRKLSVGSCTFGYTGVEAIVRGCSLLEQLSVKRLRGLPDGAATTPTVLLAKKCPKLGQL